MKTDKPFDKKKIQNIVVVGVAILAVIGILFFIYGGSAEDERNDTEVIVAGEAQRLNFGVPQTGEAKELSKTDAYDAKINDSIQQQKLAESNQLGYSSSNSSTSGYEKLNTNYASAKPSTKTNTNNYNPYGNANMWSVNEPSNSNIGYSNLNTSVPSSKSKKTKSKTIAEDLDFEPLDETPQTKYKAVTTAPTVSAPQSQTYHNPIEPKVKSQDKNSQQIAVKLVSKGNVKPGQSISFITLENAFLSNTKVPKGTRITGVINMSNSRMNVKFSSIRLKNNIYQVNLTLYGMDGLAGLPYNGDSNLKEGKDAAYSEATNQIGGGAVGSIIRGVASGFKKNNDNSISLGSEIKAIVVNENY